MKKISLHLDSLLVESFETTSVGAGGRGTVRGHVSETTCHQRLCDCETNGMECETDGCNDTLAATCPASCTFFCSQTCPVNTCAYSCEGTCGCPTWQGETCGIC